MSMRVLRSKKSIPETSQTNNNLQEYLAQYLLTDVPNPSDDSDFEDTTYNTDIEYERERKRNSRIEQREKLQQNLNREHKAAAYFNKHKNDSYSIFNQRGITFEHYDNKFISFVFSPSNFSKKHICAHRKFHLSLKYKKIGWRLKRFHVPNREEVLRIFLNSCVDDKNVIQILFKIYESLVKCTFDMINSRKEKYARYLKNLDVELNSDDEKLFLSREERKLRKTNIRNIWRRMLPPNSSEDVDSGSSGSE